MISVGAVDDVVGAAGGIYGCGGLDNCDRLGGGVGARGRSGLDGREALSLGDCGAGGSSCGGRGFGRGGSRLEKSAYEFLSIYSTVDRG